jgi:predicted Fe-Mo cluster-binding NifX family protein
MYSITNQLTNVSNSNSATSIRDGRAYNATLSVAESASLDSVSVTMSGTDITATAYNTSTKVISIASVTGDVVITASASIVITQAITWTGSSTDVSSQIIDATNANVYYEVPYNDGDERFADGVTSESAFSKVRDVALYSDAEGTNLVGYYRRDSGEIKESIRTAYNSPAFYYNTKVLVAPAGYYIQMMVTRSNPSFVTNDSFTSYVKEYGAVVTLETPEPEPEEETISNAQATENDLLQMFRSVPLDTSTIADATTYEGVLEAAKNEWMLEYSGNINKIPLICHTDQHSSMTVDNSKAMWDTIDNMVSWYDISKVINFGDTTNSYENFDNPNLGDSSLDAYLEATENVPFSKRIEIFGNHDCMQIRSGSLTYIQQEPAYLNPYFKNVMARRTSNNGYHVTYDPYFNVKYIVISNYDYVDASHYQIASPAQYDFLIEEMSKNDGYDIVICSHVGLPWYNSAINNLITARYNKTSGTGADSMGNSHSYDFTNCENDLLVCLHGHSHSDAYAYDMGVLSQCFKNYYDTTRPIYFVIVDRENNQLKVWKVTNTPEYTVYTRPFIETS